MTRFLPALVVVLVLPAAAAAHGLGVEAKLKAGTLSVEAYFDDDTPAADAKVTVEDESKAVVAEGTTDAKGVWSCAAPKPGKYAVRVDAGDGHKSKATVTVPGAVPPADEPVVVSDGPTRAAFTGPQKWAMAAVGVGLIAGGSVIARRVTRGDRRSPPAPG